MQVNAVRKFFEKEIADKERVIGYMEKDIKNLKELLEDLECE